MRTLKRLIKAVIFIAFAFLIFNIYLLYKVPVKYEYFIDSISRETGLNKSTILAVIKTESRFNAYSVSNKGAFGLMQVMPKTADYIIKKYNIKIVDKEQLLDAYTNIKIGSFYLKELLNEFKDERVAFAAYNAGPTITRKWFRESKNLSDIEILYSETKEYVKKVEDAKKDYNTFLKYGYRVPKFFSDLVLNFTYKGADKLNAVKKFKDMIDGVINEI